MIELIPTSVPHTRETLIADAETISPFAEHLHLDVVDGAFAPASCWPYVGHGQLGPVDLLGVKGVRVEVHLMVEEPREVGLRFAEAGARRMIGHVEAFADQHEILGTLDVWKEGGVEVGLALLLETPLEMLEPLIARCDVVHLMTIATIGRQGIPYEPRARARVAELHEKYPELTISVDGGVSAQNIEELARAGARRFCVGSAIMQSGDPKEAYTQLKSLAENALQ